MSSFAIGVLWHSVCVPYCLSTKRKKPRIKGRAKFAQCWILWRSHAPWCSL